MNSHLQLYMNVMYTMWNTMYSSTLYMASNNEFPYDCLYKPDVQQGWNTDKHTSAFLQQWLIIISPKPDHSMLCYIWG